MKASLILIWLVCFQVHANSYEKFAQQKFRDLDNSLTIQIIPSTYPLNWSSPVSLLWSIAKNRYWFPKTKSTIGHVMAEVNCTNNGQKIRKFSGQSVQNLDSFREYLSRGYGFSLLNQPKYKNNYPLITVPGRLDDYEPSAKRFDKLIKKKHFAVVSFQISPKSCLKIQSFIEKYTTKTKTTNRAGNVYGFGAEPKTFEGSGCAPFVQNLLELGEINDFAKGMEQVVYIHHDYLGDPTKNNSISLWEIIFSNISLQEDDQNKVQFSFPDPQVLLDKVLEIIENPKNSKYKVLRSGFYKESIPYLILSTLN